MFECAYVIGRVTDKFAVFGRVVGWNGISVYAETGVYMGRDRGTACIKGVGLGVYMPRKETITKKEISAAAFKMARREGIGEVTARKLADAAGCSTQPIFRVYENMEEVQADILEQATVFFEEFYDNYPKSQAVPFVNLGLAYISFAQKESKLFQAMFLNEDRKGKSLYELLNGTHGNVLKEIGRAKAEGCEDPQGLFMKMWIFTHGAACMAITGDYDLGITETVEMLVNAYRAFK